MKRTCVFLLVLCLLLLPNQARAATNNTAEDNFTRGNIAAGWGSTTNNDGVHNLAWQRQMSGSDNHVSLQSNMGILLYEGIKRHKEAGYLPVAKSQKGDVLAEISFTASGHTLAGVTLAVYGGYDWYQAALDTFSQSLVLTKRLNSMMTNEASVSMSLAAKTLYWIRLDVQTSNGIATVNARAWANGTSEPTNWQATWSDSSPLPAGYAGAMGDWWVTPLPGEQIDFHAWAYAASGLASAPN